MSRLGEGEASTRSSLWRVLQEGECQDKGPGAECVVGLRAGRHGWWKRKGQKPGRACGGTRVWSAWQAVVRPLVFTWRKCEPLRFGARKNLI